MKTKQIKKEKIRLYIPEQEEYEDTHDNYGRKEITNLEGQTKW